ncbi:hypothetical protein LEL_07599 [Akanthomyces lecanii RCEF 1005]|uniref:Uncharacterized protein n=1 Tax=Akanthomyces lecanii RCEF 1005 TaxID=1081108 RepID=A0A168FTV6_CORDF|nr:hypothetical protein LEL_07599 [Akanthomyces lecanii RCEF 1005]
MALPPLHDLWSAITPESAVVPQLNFVVGSDAHRKADDDSAHQDQKDILIDL